MSNAEQLNRLFLQLNVSTDFLENTSAFFNLFRTEWNLGRITFCYKDGDHILKYYDSEITEPPFFSDQQLDFWDRESQGEDFLYENVGVSSDDDVKAMNPSGTYVIWRSKENAFILVFVPEKPTFDEDDMERMIPLIEAFFMQWEQHRKYHFLEKRFSEMLQMEGRFKELVKFPSENPSPVMRYSTGAKLLYHNEASKVLLKYIEKQDIFFIDLFRNAFRNENVIEYEIEVGRERYILSIHPIPEFDYVIVYGKNITKEYKVRRELLEAKERAENLAKSESEFLSVMSHEIRTPMNAIMGSIHLLNDGKPSGDQKKNIDALQFSAENMLSILNDILDYNKLQAGMLEAENISFDMWAMLENIKECLKGRLSKENNAFELILPKKKPKSLKGDSRRLSQVLLNLLDNALKFTKDGHVSLEIVESEVEDNYYTYEFRVSDDGIGIPEDQLHCIFESFTQTDLSISRNYGGTGLGLSISKQLVALMGGELYVKSKLGRGSCFSFFLNFERSISATQLKQSKVNKKFPGIRALVVDDNDMNLMVATRFLKKWGLKVGNANSGDEALKSLKKNSYDIIFMDIQMPGMSGFEVLEELRKKEQYDHIPVVALTADSSLSIEKDIIRNGFSDGVLKPFHPEELLQILNKFLPRLSVLQED